MVAKIRSTMRDNDHSFLRTMIGLSIINMLIILWLGLQLPANSIFMVSKIGIRPTISKHIQPHVIQPQRVPKELKPQVPPHRDLPRPASTITTPQVAATPVPPGGGILKRIVFASDRESRFYQLYMIDSNGDNLERLTHTSAFDRDPHVSYDGQQVAFSSNRHGSYQIYLLDLTSRTVRQLTFGEHDQTNPIWSPNNKKILFTTHEGSCSYLSLMNADGSEQTVITGKGNHHYGYGFSPDCTKLSYEAINRNRHEIYLYDLVTKKSTAIVDYDGLTDVGDPVFSPKQNIMVFTSDSLKNNRRQLYIYDDDVKHHYRITDDDQDKDDPIFSPDGKMIAYIAKWENAWNIYVMQADGSQARNITKSRYDHVVPSWR